MGHTKQEERYLERARIAWGMSVQARGPALKAWHEKWGKESPMVSGFITSLGSACKAIGSGRVEGYLVKYGGTGDLSQYRDIFLKSTDYGRRKSSDAWVHHGLLPGLGERQLTNEAQLEPDEVGIFCKLLLDIGDKYEAALYQLTTAGKLGWSSGVLPNLVKRQPNGDGSHTVKRWILGGDASLTPSPAGGTGMRASASMKSLLLDLGVDITKPAQRQAEPSIDVHLREAQLEIKADYIRALGPVRGAQAFAKWLRDDELEAQEYDVREAKTVRYARWRDQRSTALSPGGAAGSMVSDFWSSEEAKKLP